MFYLLPIEIINIIGTHLNLNDFLSFKLVCQHTNLKLEHINIKYLKQCFKYFIKTNNWRFIHKNTAIFKNIIDDNNYWKFIKNHRNYEISKYGIDQDKYTNMKLKYVKTVLLKGEMIQNRDIIKFELPKIYDSLSLTQYCYKNLKLQNNMTDIEWCSVNIGDYVPFIDRIYKKHLIF